MATLTIEDVKNKIRAVQDFPKKVLYLGILQPVLKKLKL